MGIYGYEFKNRADVPTPAAGEAFEFIDLANDKKTRKLSDGSFVIIEGGVGSFAPLSHVGSTGVTEHGVATDLVAGFMSQADKSKLDGIAAGATVNDSNASLRDRSTHTGTQNSGTISDFNSAADTRVSLGVLAHEAAADPHPQYTTFSEAAAVAPVQSVAGKTGAVSLNSADVGLGSVDNTSDLSKPISTATQAALNNKADLVAGKVPIGQIPDAVLGQVSFQGLWDASSLVLRILMA